MRQTIRRSKHLPLAVLVQANPVLCRRPDAVAVHQNIEHVVVWQAVGRGEVLPTIARHVGSRRKQRNRNPSQQERHHKDLVTGAPFKRPSFGRLSGVFTDNRQLTTGNCHNVLRYSIRSFSSSFCRSLVTPCVSFGLKIVQISSIDFADPSCRYGAEYATFGSCGTSTNGDRSVGLPLPTSASLVFVYFGPLWHEAHWFASGIATPRFVFVRSKIALPRSCAAVISPPGNLY